MKKIGESKTEKMKAKGVALTQVFLLVLGIIAITWMVGSEVKIVSAVDCAAAGGVCVDTSTGLCLGEISGTAGLCDSTNLNVKCCTPGDNPSLATEEDAKKDSNFVDKAFEGAVLFGGAKKGYDYLFKTPGKGDAGEVVTETAKEIVDKGATGDGFFKFKIDNPTTVPDGPYSVPADKPSILLGGGSTTGTIVAITAWSAVSFLLGRYVIGPALGLNIQQSQGLGYSLAAGTATTLTLTSETLGLGTIVGISGLASLGIGVGVAFIVSIFTIKNSSADVIRFSCYAWDAEVGGENCELCNQQDIECTEYQCHSLGQGCEISVDEISGQPLCTWENSKDIKAPTITPREDSLLDDSYRYTPDNSISPPDTGVKVQYTGSQDGCAPPWTTVSFGLELDERARCKISPSVIYDTYDEMPDLFFSSGSRTYNHTFQLSLPSNEALQAENITVENGGIYDFYVRCIDSNGNSNPSNFGFSFCIQDGPDTTPPVIVSTSPIGGTPFASGQTEFDVNVYVNEPSECKWSHLDKSYELMENDFSCSTSVLEINAQNLFRCSGVLDGLKDNQENDFYFRCKDQPGANESLRNTNEQSYAYKLIGTQELNIDYATPNNEVISDSTSRVPVEIEVQTSLGYDDGKAVCSFSDTGQEGTFIGFFYGQGVEPYTQYMHTQSLNLEEGDYTYYIRCSDLGGNVDETTISFSVETDLNPPEIVRVFKDQGNLKVITSEEGRCVYSDFGCAYDFDQDGTYMSTLSGGDDAEHYASWPENAKTTYYIKCQDSYGNRPQSNQCSLVVRPFDIPDVR